MRGACSRYSQAPNSQPSKSAQAIPSAIAHHRPAISVVTSGVKYKPSAAPMVHCPALRSAPELSVGAPAMDSTEVATRGPIIQGSGVCSATQAAAAAQAAARVRATRRIGKGVRDMG